MLSAVYKGKEKPYLRGKKALVRESEKNPATILAQFDDLQLWEAYNWHEFYKTDFEVSQ